MGQSRPSTQTTSVPDWISGPAQELLGAGMQEANRPYQSYPGARVAPFTPMQNNAFAGIGDTMYGSQGLDNAQGSIASILGGGTNPYLDQVLNRSRRGVVDAYNQATAGTTARFNEPGQWGGSAHMQATRANNDALAQGLSDMESGVRYSDFTNNLNRQMQAAPIALQLAQGQQGLFEGGLRAGNLQQGYGQQLFDTLYNDWSGYNNNNRNNLDWLGQLFGRVQGAGGQTTTMQEGSNPWSTALGAGLLGYGLFNTPTRT